MDESFNNIFTIVLAVLAVVAWRYMPRLIAGAPFVDGGEVHRRMNAGEVEVVIDVRSEGEYLGDGHIPGAVNLPFADLATRLRAIGADLEPLKALPVVVTCATEQRASHAARALRKAGFTGIAVLKGGMKAWKRVGLPLEKGHPDANAEPAPEETAEIPAPVAATEPADVPTEPVAATVDAAPAEATAQAQAQERDPEREAAPKP